MLILTRRVGETLMIGDEVSVTILSAKGNNIRIGINAPKEVAVHREEVYQRIARQGEQEQRGEQEQQNRQENTDSDDSTSVALTEAVND